MVSGLVYLEGKTATLAVFVPGYGVEIPFLQFSGTPFSLTLLFALNLCFWSVLLYYFAGQKGKPSEVSAFFFLQFSLTGLILAATPMTLSFFWVLSALFHHFLSVRSAETPQTQTRSLGFTMLSAAGFVVAVGGIFSDMTSSFYLATNQTAMATSAPVLSILVLISCVARLGLWPFHGWLALAAQNSRSLPGSVLCVLYPTTGLFPLVVFQGKLPPLFDQGLCGLGVISVAYLSLCALGEREVYRFLSYLRGALLSLILVVSSLGAVPEKLGFLASSQTIAIFTLFLFFAGLSRGSNQTWIWKPDGTPGFQGLWHRYRNAAWIAAGVLATGAMAPSLASLNPSLEVWTTLMGLAPLPLIVVSLSVFVLSFGVIEKYRAIFLTPGDRPPTLGLSPLALLPVTLVLFLFGLTSVAALLLGGIL